MIYGIRSRELAAAPLPGNCPICERRECREMHLLQRYVHALWLPLFPIGRKGEIRCQHCAHKVKAKDFNELQQDQLAEMRQTHRTPAWYYTGLIIFGGLVVYSVYVSGRRSERNAAWLQAPQRGDVYEVRIGADAYTLMQVQNLKGDSVQVQFSALTSNKRTGLTKLYLHPFEGHTTRMHVKKLLSMHADGEIVDVKRE